MPDPLNTAVEMALKAAEQNKDFENLPGAGKPLPFLDNPRDAVLDRIMKEHRAKPLAVTLKVELADLAARLKAETDPDRQKALMAEMAARQLRLDLELEAMRRYG